MAYEIVKTEYTNGTHAGADYGSQARVLMRSPEHYIFVAQGVHINKRGNHTFRNGLTICKKANRFTLDHPDVRAKIIEIFGEGADQAALDTTTKKGFATALIDGGGDPLPLPRAIASKNHYEAYARETISCKIIPENIKRCMQCGEPLVMETVSHSPTEILSSIEECQRTTNNLVVSIASYDQRYPDKWKEVSYFHTWDGESYRDPHFCTNNCAIKYAHRAAEAFEPLPVSK